MDQGLLAPAISVVASALTKLYSGSKYSYMISQRSDGEKMTGLGGYGNMKKGGSPECAAQSNRQRGAVTGNLVSLHF